MRQPGSIIGNCKFPIKPVQDLKSNDLIALHNIALMRILKKSRSRLSRAVLKITGQMKKTWNSLVGH
jgi:hypothetical protein